MYNPTAYKVGVGRVAAGTVVARVNVVALVVGVGAAAFQLSANVVCELRCN